MAVPGPYSGVSTLAFVARTSAFAFGVVYGSFKLSYLKAKQGISVFYLGLLINNKNLRERLAKAKSHEKAKTKDHH